jgi:hypothetical protein
MVSTGSSGSRATRATKRLVGAPTFLAASGTAAAGASLRELMGRMGHSTTRAALIYQHRTAERDRLIASVMSELVEAELDEMACHRARSGTRATGRILMSGKRNYDHACEQAFRRGAGDENRTRTISLGI